MRMDVELELPARPASVEYVLRDHWHSDSAPVFYVENALINSLFGLLCWPAIFAPLPGAFFHPFQSGPADLSAPDFVQRRAALFEECLAHLDDGSWREVIVQRHADKQGLQDRKSTRLNSSHSQISYAVFCLKKKKKKKKHTFYGE